MYCRSCNFAERGREAAQSGRPCGTTTTRVGQPGICGWLALLVLVVCWDAAGRLDDRGAATDASPGMLASEAMAARWQTATTEAVAP